MKKGLLLFVILAMMIFFPRSVLAEDRITGEYGTYDKAIKIIQEVLRDYYIRGESIQYNYARAQYGEYPPEEATKQDNRYFVCACFTFSAYKEAFGVTRSSGEFPYENKMLNEDAREYYNANKNNSSKLNGSYLIYYERKSDNTRYIYKNKTSINDFAQIIQPGDLFTYTGHTMIAYKTVKRDTGKWDVLMLNAFVSPTVPSRITGTARLQYNLFPSDHEKNNNLDIEKEGGLKYFWLSESSFSNNGNLKCNDDECSVIRAFYNNNGKAVFNYSIVASQYKRSELRLKYPGLYIEKTVETVDRDYKAIDNGSVYLGDEIRYTITITNKSNTTYDGKAFGKFIVEEKLNSNLVTYKSVSSSKSGTIITKPTSSNYTIKWEVPELKKGETITLKYRVAINNKASNVNKQVESTGKFYEPGKSSVYLSTGEISNTIIPKVSETKSYKSCFDSKKSSSSGLKLINEIYKCVWNKDYSFTNFKFDKIFNKPSSITTMSSHDTISFKTSLDSTHTKFKAMILNNLWSGVIKFQKEGYNGQYVFPRWNEGDNLKRVRNIYSDYFKDGDVLIYSVDYSNTDSSLKHTNENGIYAYIYINGKFVGVNYSGKSNERNQFTYNYYSNLSVNGKTGYSNHLYSGYSKITSSYNKDGILTYINYLTLFDKDYYIVLRPEIVIASETASTPKPTVTYPKGDVDGDGEVTANDYKKIRFHLLKLDIMKDDVLKRADVNGDGKVDSTDYNIIRKILLKM